MEARGNREATEDDGVEDGEEEEREEKRKGIKYELWNKKEHSHNATHI